MGDSEKIEKDHNKSVNYYIKRNVGEHFFTKCLPLAFLLYSIMNTTANPFPNQQNKRHILYFSKWVKLLFP